MGEKHIPESKEFWSEIAQDYHHVQYKNVKEYPSLIVRHNYILDLFDQGGGRVLDIGCGPGEMVIDLLRRKCEVHGVDIAEGMIDVARNNVIERFPDGKAVLAVGNIEKMDFQDKMFDAVICAGVVEYLSSDDKALREINRVLRVGGTLVLTVRNKMCPARFLESALDCIKGTKSGLAFLNKMKKLVQGKKTQDIVYTPYRKHNPWKFDSTLSEYGFTKEDFRYFHFYPFIAQLDKVFPGFYIKAGLKMEKLSNSRFGWLGSGYIVKARKIKDF